jgi:hypothetical protein
MMAVSYRILAFPPLADRAAFRQVLAIPKQASLDRASKREACSSFQGGQNAE